MIASGLVPPVDSSPEDEQLVAAALGGSDAAFPALIERYQERLLRFLLARGVLKEDAEDALQTAFLNAYRYLGSFDPRWRFSTWMYRIALRSVPTSPPSSVAGGVREDVDALVDEHADPERDYGSAATRDNLWRTAGRLLNEDARTALWLHYVEDMSIGDTAQAMQRSVSWVKVTLMRSRRRLAPALAQSEQAGYTDEQFG